MPRNKDRHRAFRTALMCFTLVFSSLSLFFVTKTSTAQAGLPAQPNSVNPNSPNTPNSPNSPNGLVINEAYDASQYTNEYFELYNTSAQTINLSTYVIYNRDSQIALSHLATPTIGPGEFRGIGPAQLGGLWFSTGSGGLAQTDFLGLVNTSPSDAVIDVVNWGGAPNLNWPNYDRFRNYFFTSNIPIMPQADDPQLSLQRYPDGQDTNTGNDFAQIQRSPNNASCADPYEGRTNDDVRSRASAQDVGTTTLHRLCPAGDTDYISLSLSQNFTYTLRTTIPTGSAANTVLRLYTSDGALLAEDNNSATNDSIIRFRPSATGTYYAQVLDAAGNGPPGGASLYSFSVTADTSVTATPTPPASSGCTDSYEPDDQLGAARPIILNSEQTHTFCHPDGTQDNDWVAIDVSAGKVYTVLTKDLADPVDTILSIHEADGTKLIENDDYQPGTSLASRIDYSFSRSGTYYVRVRNKTNEAGRSGYQYTISFESTGQLPPTGTSTASPTTNPNTPTPTVGQCTDSYEPDGIAEAAKLINIGTTQHHSICPVADADWVTFFAKAGKVYSIRTANLGVGLDTYMYLFDTDGATILAQNDDGGDGVASRIDFYPQRDAWYFAQVKNAGDIGGPDQMYDLVLAVQPGVPQPPGTATAIIAPPVQSTPPVQPSVVIQPTTPATKPPLPTPTQGEAEPTLAAVPPPAATDEPTLVVAEPSVTRQPAAPTATTAQAEPTSPAEVPAAETPVDTGGLGDATPTTQVVIVPGPPKTGATSGQVVAKPKQQVIILPVKPAAPAQTAPVLFRLFYDSNHNDSYDAGEGVRGVHVYFLNKNATTTANGEVTTGDNGSGAAVLPLNEQRVLIPYFGINVPLAHFPGREGHSLWLPTVALPSRVP